MFHLTGSALDLHFNDVNIASIDRELEDQEGSDLGLASKKSNLYNYTNLKYLSYLSKLLPIIVVTVSEDCEEESSVLFQLFLCGIKGLHRCHPVYFTRDQSIKHLLFWFFLTCLMAWVHGHNSWWKDLNAFTGRHYA